MLHTAANLETPEIGVTIQPNWWGTGPSKWCLRYWVPKLSHFLPHFAQNIHVEWPKLYKLEKLIGLFSSS